MATGSGKEIVAHGAAAAKFAATRASVIESGGQDSKFILIDAKGAYDYAMNEMCAAGTGAFLDVQGERLGLSIEELSTMAAAAATVSVMAGLWSLSTESREAAKSASPARRNILPSGDSGSFSISESFLPRVGENTIVT